MKITVVDGSHDMEFFLWKDRVYVQSSSREEFITEFTKDLEKTAPPNLEIMVRLYGAANSGKCRAEIFRIGCKDFKINYLT